MTQNITGLGPKEAEFLITFSSRNKKIFTVKEARSFWEDPNYTTNMLDRLQSKGWLRRLERGKYMIVPLEAGPDRNWTESGLVMVPHLIQPAAVAYWSAFHYWQMSEQIPRTVFVQSTKRKLDNKKEILGIEYRFVKVVDSKFFKNIKRTIDGKTITVTDREKTLVDALDRPDLCGGIAHIAHGLDVNWEELDWDGLDDVLLKWPTRTPYKRLGYLVETLQLDIPNRNTRLSKWRNNISSGISPLEPGHDQDQGPIKTRWNLRLNIPINWTEN